MTSNEPLEARKEDTAADAVPLYAVAGLAVVLFAAAVVAFARYGGPTVNALSRQLGETVAADALRLAEAGMAGDAIRMYERALSIPFENPRQAVLARQRLARLLLDEGDPAAAVPVLEAALAADPADLWNYSLLCTAYLRSGAPEQALATATAWLERAQAAGDTGGIRWAHYNRGTALNRLGDAAGALAAYEASYAAVPSGESAYQAALLLQRAGRTQEARDYAARAIEHGPDDAARRARALLRDMSP